MGLLPTPVSPAQTQPTRPPPQPQTETLAAAATAAAASAVYVQSSAGGGAARCGACGGASGASGAVASPLSPVIEVRGLAEATRLDAARLGEAAAPAADESGREASWRQSTRTLSSSDEDEPKGGKQS